MTMFHYTDKSLLNCNDPVDIILVGVGGTGSQILTGLGQINHAICELGHETGIRVISIDPDTVSPSNIGRQLFAPVDIGSSKARILTERINRFYGLSWRSITDYFSKDLLNRYRSISIIISCVDTVSARRKISSSLKEYYSPVYWLDLGNAENTGQVILATYGGVNQPEGGYGYLPSIFDYFPNMEDSENVNTPSCSMAEALESQDLFINRTIASFGLDIIWRLFRYARIKNHGCFVNLEDYRVNPVTVESSHQRFSLKEVA